MASRRERNDLFLVYKVLLGKTSMTSNNLFKLVPSYSRSNRLKLCFAQPRTTLRQFFICRGALYMILSLCAAVVVLPCFADGIIVHYPQYRLVIESSSPAFCTLSLAYIHNQSGCLIDLNDDHKRIRTGSNIYQKRDYSQRGMRRAN